MNVMISAEVMETGLADERAMVRAAQQNPAAFAALYDAYFTRVFRYVRKRVGTTEEAEDITSEVFVRAFRSLRDMRGPSFAAWIFRIAHNQVANHHRDRREVSLLDEDRPDSRDAFSHVDNREMVWKLVGALTPEQQEAVRLKFAGELSAKEIGLVMKKSIPAVGMLLSRAMQSLRAAAGNEVV